MTTPLTKTLTICKCLCLRCGWSWWPRVDDPAKCPHCTSPYWKKPRQVLSEDEKLVGLLNRAHALQRLKEPS